MERKYKNYMIKLIIIVGITIIPLCIISHYNHPSVDDYAYSYITYQIWNETGSLVGVLRKAFETTILYWKTWQGLYSSAFFLALQPALLGEQCYILTGYIMLTTIIGSTSIFCIYFVKKICGGHILEALAISAGITFLTLQWMPSAVQGLYWYNGAINYGFFHGILLILICFLIELQCSSGIRKIVMIICSCILGFILEGGNHVTALIGLVIIFLFTIVSMITKKEKSLIYIYLINMGIMIIGFLINLLAPGTSMRQSALGESMPLTKAVCAASVKGIFRVFEYFDFKMVIVLIVLLPVFISITKSTLKKGFFFPYPFIIFIASIIWIAIMLFPPIYAMGHTGAERLNNIVYYHFIILLFINVFYIIGWSMAHVNYDDIKVNITLAWELSMCILIFSLFLYYKDYSWSMKALLELKNGIPQQYSQEAYERDEILRMAKGKNVLIDDFSVKSELLYFDGPTKNPDDWQNGHVKMYYQLESVAIK